MSRMSDMVAIVNVIAESSSKVRYIADAIARIASQTNMLSLNAALATDGVVAIEITWFGQK